MENNLIACIALDLGTTSIKAGLLDRHGELGNLVIRHAPKIAVNGGHYESDALAYAQIAEQVLKECIAQAGDCITFGMCSQRSSFLIWEQATGQPLTPLISWQDTRGAASCDALRTHGEVIRSLTGLPLTPYYFAAKLRVVLQENPLWRARLELGELRVGTLDTFLIWRWTGGRLFVTDASMAARTQLMDIRRQQWSNTLCDLFDIPMHILPVIMSSVAMDLQLDSGLKLQASVGDQSAAVYAGVMQDEALVNLGTGCFVVRYLPEHTARPDGYLQTLVYQDGARHSHFAIEGTLNSIAEAFAPYPVAECRFEDLAVDDICCVAEPSGLGAPYFNREIGIRYSRPVDGLTQARIAMLLLEAVIFRVARILEEFHAETQLQRVYLSGGLSGLDCLQQGISCCAPVAVYSLAEGESSLRGAALLAAGMAPADSRAAQKVGFAGDARQLQEKYLRWKLWLDEIVQRTGT